jgi:heme-degrading monooxygenase HmoA
MPYLLVRLNVAAYAKWKPVFDEYATIRQAEGSRGGRLLRNADTPNEMIMLFEWEDLAQARRLFAQSEEVREALQRTGVADQPDVSFLEEVTR